tara:strand:- start:106992 stop:107762 length:771 start_codon:yes stop_codon:yes gene_type:complete
MSIDWITVIAQIANFLVLVWLLKHFLYRPILDGIDAREAEISKRMHSAEEAQKKAKIAAEEYRKQQEKLLADQETMVNQALKDSEGQRDSLLADARAKLEQEYQDWHKQQERESQKFTTALHQAGAQTMLELTRKALHDLADQTLEEAIVRHVGARLQPIAEDIREAAGASTAAEATTHEPLSKAAQDQMQAEIEQLLPGTSLTFAVDPDQAPGLILRVGGAQVAWTIDSYTDELDALLHERMAVGTSDRMQSDVG